ncbi:hypothetical protein K490DRAFT_5775, partial [Saccharata proteae CBS 121410]
ADPRFKNIHTDPRFRLPSAKNTHVTLDKRFAHMLRDDDFATKASVDRYGRKVSKDAGQKELKRFYRVEDEDKDDDEEEDEREEDDDEDVEKELAKAERNYDPAREGGFSSSEDDSDSDSDDEDEDELAVEDTAEVEFPQGKSEDVPMGEISRRLAVVNLDWDNIRAADLMAVASSFAPADGRILNVTVYPSEFGRERMEREELEGPPREIFANARKDKKSEDSESDEEDEDEEIKKDLLKEDAGEEFDSTALRSYQLERLRYFYAVITASSTAAAKSLYDAMDGREYLSSANFFDLRFIPDDVSFDDDKPRDSCDRVPDGYKPNEFVTDALTHSRVKLTWDADDTQRKEVQKRAFSQKEIDDNDLMAYVGSDSESSSAASEDEAPAHTETSGASSKKKTKEDKAAKLRAALGLSSESSSLSKKKSDGPVGDMQVTFTSGVSANNKKGAVFENSPIIEETTREKYIRKEKERKARRKEKAKAVRDGVEITFDDDDDGDAAPPSATEKQADAAEAGANDDDDNDDPFNDPFFEDPAGASRAAAKAARKAEKAKHKEERAAAEAAAAQERAQLELLMADEDAAANGGKGLKHFDMHEIEKAEKAARRKGKAKKGAKKKQEELAAAAVDDQFKMDTEDPRFRSLFESHEFAIDPTNPRFKGTKGMRALLEEGRRKRKSERDGEGEEVVSAKKARKGGVGAGDGGEGAGADDLKRLVERVKGKTRK